MRGEWFRTAQLRPYVILPVHDDELVVMPNHVHGVVWILEEIVGATRRVASMPPTGPVPGSVGAIIRQFKSIINCSPRPAHPSGSAIITNTLSAMNAPLMPYAATLLKTTIPILWAPNLWRGKSGICSGNPPGLWQNLSVPLHYDRTITDFTKGV